MNYKKEIYYFIKAIVLVIIFNGLLSAMMIFLLSPGQLADTGNAMQVLGQHIYWIIPLSMLLTTYILHLTMPKIEPKRFGIEFAKVVLYYALVTLVQNLLL